MSESLETMLYSRRGGTGTVHLRGVIDIFEARQLHTLALQAFQDARAQKIRVNMSSVERLDISALQILLALKQDLQAEGRSFSLDAVPNILHDTLRHVDKLNSI